MSVTNPFQDDGSSLLGTFIALAIAVFALLFLKGFFAPPDARRNHNPAHRNPLPPNNTRNTATTTSGASVSHRLQTSSQTTAAPPQRTAIRTLTISAPGVLLEEQSPESFSEGATILPSAIAALQSALKGNSPTGNSSGGGSGTISNSSSLSLANTNVYILCQVSDDIGEAAVRAALEFSGLMGSNQGQIPSQRFLFCETLVGKMSLVRQIEPEVHIDGDSSTVEQLKRFIPRLIQVKTSSPANKIENINQLASGQREGSTAANPLVVQNFEQALKSIGF